ncbi:oxidoreductase [Enteractinococcus helveticum]|uniref:Oxidoreductase n=1 Tax=Enteractinococcus helveticum TaxID=1837282 RepID=A0A1B7LVB9_9MICC|nr:oxidoreductase [Enteractinococcus helveticum]
MDPIELRNTLGHFATGVNVLTYESQGTNYGMTINSFTSVSLDPALVLVSIDRSSKALPYLMENFFAINVMSEDQLDVALQFAGKPQEDLVIDWVFHGLAPRIGQTAAYFQCRPWETYDGGDHVLIVAQVDELGQNDDAQPLLFHRGKWGALAASDRK